MIRVTVLILALVTAAGGALLAWIGEDPADPSEWYCRMGLCGTTAPTVQTEPTNPFVWCDLAESKATAGDLEGARAAFREAARLGPNIPPVLIRIVNFEVANGELPRVLGYLRHVLELTPSYDAVIFRYLSRGGLKGGEVLRTVIPAPGEGSAAEIARRTKEGGRHATAPDGETRPRGDAARGWVSYLIGERSGDAESAYAWLHGHGGITPALRNQWIEYLVGVRRDYDRAITIWGEAQGDPDYPTKNRIFDGGFIRERIGGRMDWAITKHPGVKLETGKGLHLQFEGKENLTYGHVSQQTYLPAGRWQFEAETVANGLTTDQRPYFRIYDTGDPRRLDVSTPMAPERMAVEVNSPAGGSWVAVTLMRRQSEKFDSKIAGTLEIRRVRLRR